MPARRYSRLPAVRGACLRNPYGQRVRGGRLKLRLVKLYGHASIQAGARNPRRRFGVPPGGPLDPVCAGIANSLAGNKPGAPVLELLNAHALFECLEAGSVAIAGAPVNVDSGGRWIGAGETLEICAPRQGAAVYLAVGGGWGGIVAPGSVLVGGSADAIDGTISRRPDLESRLRVVPGPQLRLFDANWLTDQVFRVLPSSDRVGLRLHGRPQAHEVEIVSEPSVVGSIQLTREGQPIVLGPDGPTIGGYPKIAVVCTADLHRLGQLGLGSEVSLEWIDFAEARELAAIAASLRNSTGSRQNM